MIIILYKIMVLVLRMAVFIVIVCSSGCRTIDAL